LRKADNIDSPLGGAAVEAHRKDAEVNPRNPQLHAW
jgi:hypothetical protein